MSFQTQATKITFSVHVYRHGSHLLSGLLQVTEAGDIRLPGWLQFDVKNRRLIGLPDVHDEGKVYICVKAYGSGMRHQGNSLDEQSVSDEKSTQFKDIFSIEVLPNKLKNPHCHYEPRMTLMVDADLHFLPLESKIEMTCSLANCLGVPLESLRLTAMPQSNILLIPSLHDDSHIRSGAGDGHKRTKSGIQFEWNMKSDCENQLTAEAEEQIKIVESTAKDGTLKHLLRHRVLGWHVRGTSLGNQVSGFSIMRQRRDMGISQTPMPGSEFLGDFSVSLKHNSIHLTLMLFSTYLKIDQMRDGFIDCLCSQ